jgi:hypothetical protein
MKATILSSVFAMAVVACVQPADPEAAARPQTGVTEQSFVEGEYVYCVTAGPERCIVFPVREGASQQCLNACRNAGFPSPRCVYVNVDNWPCE